MGVSTTKQLPTKQLPGLGLPIDHEDKRGTTFPLAVGLDPWDSKGVTLREQRMLDFVSQITDKPGWELKVFDEEIVSRWRAEADVRPESLEGDVQLSPRMFDFCIAELREKSEEFRKTGYVRVLDSELTVVKSDSAVSKDIQDALRAGVRPLEDVPDHLKDWHPFQEDTVLDLVHPSLFPVVWGLTRALEEDTVPLENCAAFTGKGVVTPAYTPPPKPASPGWTWRPEAPRLWGSFQWLPAQVELAADGAASITSYINNLDPVGHKGLYSILERIVSATVPLWEEALSGFVDARRFDISYTGSEDYTFPPGLKYHIPGRSGPRSVWDPIKEVYDDHDGNNNDADDDVDDDDEDWKWEEDYYDWKRDHRVLMHREPREYTPQAEILAKRKTTVNLRNDYPGGLQVIFKLANIHLDPETPEYPGGAWHVEGTLNEMICASALYYYDQDNITDSHLAFRQALDPEELVGIPEQSEYYSLEQYLGIEQDGPALQPLGQILTREGRLLVFPNCLQHQVQPFELKDRARPGHRKILAMFLVDPHRPILSSAHVPPQRRDWWANEVRGNGALSALPNEIVDMTINMVDEFPISWDRACELRLQLMEERGGFKDQVTEFFEETTFSFCEH
ncbi:hypothetical protein C8A05DRAFT_13993 [Staphylotrichum tortipilum]|uniref:Duf1665 domain containing protein n=1 Tax=Staphylotrichum tortipilum TaxID=2831512 RepID=A0AAN6MPM5_9PEZI|nr:hypothetical protein C8A05DRAFT_13993 [Staphylotrichum longicolle]